MNLFTAFAAMGGGKVVSWGNQPTMIPLDEDVVTVSAGFSHSMALTQNGRVFAWGDNDHSQTEVPAACDAGIIAIAAGGMHSMALSGKGKIYAWGSDEDGQCSLPDDAKNSVIAISAGLFHSMALKKNGEVVTWGYNEFGQSWVPTGLDKVTAVAAGAFHSMALRQSGEIVVWGDNAFGQREIPAEAFGAQKIAAGYFHNLALTATGGVVAWGDNSSGQCNVPAAARQDVVAIAAGQLQSIALKADGTLVVWGGSGSIRSTSNREILPVASAISAGGTYNLAVVPESADTNGDGIPDWWEVMHGFNRVNYDARLTDSDLDGASDLEEFTADTDPNDADSYFATSMNMDPADGTTLHFGPVSPDRIYTIEYTSSLGDGSWTMAPAYQSVRGTALSAVDSATLDLSSNPARIYRVRVSLP